MSVNTQITVKVRSEEHFYKMVKFLNQKYGHSKKSWSGQSHWRKKLKHSPFDYGITIRKDVTEEQVESLKTVLALL